MNKRHLSYGFGEGGVRILREEDSDLLMSLSGGTADRIPTESLSRLQQYSLVDILSPDNYRTVVEECTHFRALMAEWQAIAASISENHRARQDLTERISRRTYSLLAGKTTRARDARRIEEVTRDSTALQERRQTLLRTARSGCAGFVGERDVERLLTDTVTFHQVELALRKAVQVPGGYARLTAVGEDVVQPHDDPPDERPYDPEAEPYDSTRFR